eukprot:CAMPEP_0174909836 /NCGR_PEP_ID=MMETSP0167-20121228/70316_1 /TAXON_ID=38298 /ORGANISM="Rhodella maculata, Strain CCMP736" /LENGTH=72 /DNA_ID=CAMNT_0016153943 /DNA_START=54 /DNA_END=269 /DNA_ORIENTATION=+
MALAPSSDREVLHMQKPPTFSVLAAAILFHRAPYLVFDHKALRDGDKGFAWGPMSPGKPPGPASPQDVSSPT